MTIAFTAAMAQWLRAARAETQLSQTFLGEALKLKQGTISRLERQRTKRMTKARWQRLHEYLVEKGAVAFSSKAVPRHTGLVDRKKLAADIRRVKAAGTSTAQLAEAFGVHPKTLQRFLGGKLLGEPAVQRLKVGVDRLVTLPEELKAQGYLPEEPTVKTVKRRGPNKPKAKPSLIEHVSSGGLDLDACENKMMALLEGRIARLRAMVSVVAANGLAKHH